MAQCFHEEAQPNGSRCAALAGFSLHANTRCGPTQREKLERLCRYVARPPVAHERLIQRADGLLVYKLKKAYQDGTEYLLFSPQEFLEKLAALVPIPRVHLIRFHGCLAPHARIRSLVVPGSMGKDKQDQPRENGKRRSARSSFSWASLLQRVFKIDVKSCHCGGNIKIIAAVLEPQAIRKILNHIGFPATPPTIAPARAPPRGDFED
jgi:hypothetical protein